MVSPWVTGALQGFEKGFAQQELAKNKAISQAILLKELQRKTDEDARKKLERENRQKLFSSIGERETTKRQLRGLPTETLAKRQKLAKDIIQYNQPLPLEEETRVFKEEQVPLLKAQKTKETELQDKINKLQSLIYKHASGAGLTSLEKVIGKGLGEEIFPPALTKNQLAIQGRINLLTGKGGTGGRTATGRTGGGTAAGRTGGGFQLTPDEQRAYINDPNSIKITKKGRWITVQSPFGFRKYLDTFGEDETRVIDSLTGKIDYEKKNTLVELAKEAFGPKPNLKRFQNTLGSLMPSFMYPEGFTWRKAEFAKAIFDNQKIELKSMIRRTLGDNKRLFKQEMETIDKLLPDKGVFENVEATIEKLAALHKTFRGKINDFSKQIKENPYMDDKEKGELVNYMLGLRAYMEKMGNAELEKQKLSKKGDDRREKSDKRAQRMWGKGTAEYSSKGGGGWNKTTPKKSAKRSEGDVIVDKTGKRMTWKNGQWTSSPILLGDWHYPAPSK